MKRILHLLAVFTLSVFVLSPALSRAQDGPPPGQDGPGGPPPGQDGGPGPGDDQDVSFQAFYDQLGDQDGSWIQTDDYGYVFQPNVQDPDWAPYTDGHWVYSDEGWTWVSDEPWGWATYHYGRWANIDGTGWVWVPGYRWAPAWVSWRYGGGYVGWAPLPPEAAFGDDSDYHFGSDVDAHYHIGAGWYNFVPEGRVGDPDLRGAYVDRHQNFSVIHNTKNITNINISRNQGGRGGFGGIAANGPPINDINAHASHRIPTVQLSLATGPGRSAVQGNTLSIYAPRVNASTAHQGRPAAVSQNINHPKFNHGQSAAKPLTVHASVRSPGATGNATVTPSSIHATDAANTGGSFHSQGGQNFHAQGTTSANVQPQAQVHHEQQHTATTPTENFQPQAQVHHEQHTATPPAENDQSPATVHHEAQHTTSSPAANFQPQTSQVHEERHTETAPGGNSQPQNQVHHQDQPTEKKAAPSNPQPSTQQQNPGNNPNQNRDH